MPASSAAAGRWARSSAKRWFVHSGRNSGGNSEKAMSKKDCKNCRGGPETFWYMKYTYVYDVDKARVFTSDGRESVELDPDDVRASVAESDINPVHIDHVDPSLPGRSEEHT